ncbi:MAG: hypothetical protein SO016_01355 [Lachnospiraceae bacterium]|nr:hypothetical protein [Lachnospiraceae bacterium]
MKKDENLGRKESTVSIELKAFGIDMGSLDDTATLDSEETSFKKKNKRAKEIYEEDRYDFDSFEDDILEEMNDLGKDAREERSSTAVKDNLSKAVNNSMRAFGLDISNFDSLSVETSSEEQKKKEMSIKTENVAKRVNVC